jgi:hypothetical protein
MLVAVDVIVISESVVNVDMPDTFIRGDAVTVPIVQDGTPVIVFS